MSANQSQGDRPLNDPKSFLHIPRVTETPRPVPERLGDFRHVYAPPRPEVVTEQARRCMGCGVPFCHGDHGCPVENLIPEWNELMAKGRLKEAVALLHATNNFPEFTGYLCPAPCEAACVLSLTDSPVTIRQIELAIVSEGFAHGYIRPERAPRRLGLSVGIVGSGPAGLAAAQQLARRGYEVTVYEKADRPGGLLRYGIPDFKLEKWVLDRRLGQLLEEGVRFRTSVTVGQDVSLDELTRTHHAVALTVGAEEPRELAVPGRELAGIHRAMDYLVQQNRRVAGGEVQELIDAKGRDVVIIGGGDTGSDCLGTALRQGARSVRQFEVLAQPPLKRADETPWPLWPLKLRSSHAHDEGGERLWSVATTGFSGTSGRVSQIHGCQVERRGSGFVPVAGSDWTMAADLVILAIGFSGVERALAHRLAGGVRLTARETVVTDAHYMTELPGVFAAGDARRGASLIVWAIAEGRKMAAAMDRYLLQ